MSRTPRGRFCWLGLGGTLLNGEMELPGGDLIAQCLDPQGAAFALHTTATD